MKLKRLTVAQSRYFITTAKLTPYAKRPRSATGYVTAYTFEPGPGEPAADLGNLYAVIEVISGGREAEEAIDLTIEALGTAYYNEGHGTNILDRFESATKAVNRALSEFVNGGNAGWVGKMSAVLAVLSGDELHLAYTGSAEAYLYRGDQATQITVKAHDRVQQPSKIFAQVASGQLGIGDRILLATPALVHQLSLDELSKIMAHHTPSAAIAEIAARLDGQPTDRVAALAIQFSTPDLAAATLAANTPNHTQLQSKPTLIDQAKEATAPITQAASQHSKRLGQKLQQNGKPWFTRLRQGTLSAIGHLRGALQGDAKSRRRVMVALGGVVIIIILLIMVFHGSANTSKVTQQFQTIDTQVQADQTAASAGDARVRPQLASLQTQLAALATPTGTATLNRWLAKKPKGQLPSSVAALQAQIQTSLDTIDHLHRVAATTVATLTAKAGAAYTMLTLAGTNQAVAATPTGQISTINLKTGTAVASSASNVSLGKVLAITASATTGNVYLLTNQPGIWVYQPISDKLTKVNPAAETPWSAAINLATYASNLYLLTSSGVNKYLPTASGFSQPITALPSSDSGVSTATTLAIDGTITVGGPQGLYRYLSGTLSGQGPVPSGLKGITTLLPGNGDYFSASDAGSGRLAIIGATSKTLTATDEYTLASGHLTTAAVSTVDGLTGTAYALSGNTLVKFPVSGL